MADWFEVFLGMKAHVLIRFGRWRDILAEPMPADSALFCSTAALWRYARSVALANLRDAPEARAELARFRASREAVPESRTLFNNTVADVLAIAEAMAEGEVAWREGTPDAAVAHLLRAVALEDALPDDESWGWMQPARHALGALLLEAGHLGEAEAVYRADLGLDDPHKVWSLHGLHECLSRRGDKQEILHIRQRLDQALARAEVPIRASCYCSRHAA